MVTLLIEQTTGKLKTAGGSKLMLIPATFLEKLQINEDTEFTLRLMKGKHGLFIDIFKTKRR